MTADPAATKAASASLRPWIALALPPLAWFVFEVGLASALRLSCRTVGAGLGVGWGGASLLVCALAVGIARSLARPATDPSPIPVWLARLAQCLAGLFALAIAFQTIATLIVPPCAR